jgi:hypothetical protein
MTNTGKNRIMIFGPKTDGTYVVEFRTAAGEALPHRMRGDPPFSRAHALWALRARHRAAIAEWDRDEKKSRRS